MAMMQKDSGFGLLVHVPAYDKKSRQLSHHHNIFFGRSSCYCDSKCTVSLFFNRNVRLAIYIC
jgi:hypothetical protein